MPAENPHHATPSRRVFLAGATAAGISAVVASQAPQAAADTRSTPVKLVCNLRRRPDLTPVQFYDYWLNSHGPFAAEQIRTLGGTATCRATRPTRR